MTINLLPARKKQIILSRMEKKRPDICPHCKRVNTFRIYEAYGEKVCNECGAVIEDRLIDQSYERRGVDSLSRIGGQRDEHRLDSGFNTTIVNAKGRYTELIKAQLKDSQSALDKSFASGSSIIADFCTILNLPADIMDYSKSLLKKVIANKKLKGRNLESVAAAVVFETAEKRGNPRSLKEIISKTMTVRKSVLKWVSFVREFSMPGSRTNESVDTILEHLCARTDAGSKLRLKAIEVLKKIKSLEVFGGQSRYTIAGVALSLPGLAMELELTYEKVAESANITVATLKQGIKKVWPIRKKLLPESLIDSPAYKDD